MLDSDSVSAHEKYYCGYQNNSSLKIDEIVEDCGDCQETLCKKSRRLMTGTEEENVCLWNDYSGSCVAAPKVQSGPLESSEIQLKDPGVAIPCVFMA